MHRTASSFVALLTGFTVACSGGTCGRPPAPAAAQATGGAVPTEDSGVQLSAADIREPLLRAQREFAAALGNPVDPDRLSVSDVTSMAERMLAAAETSERTLQRETFDAGAVAGRVGPDHIRLFQWVRDNTTLVPYQGVLRGPTGVLMDRMGNSLDRALLLAELLRATGATVRLAHGQLTPEQALAIAKHGQALPTRPPSSSSPGDDAAAIATQAAGRQLDTARLSKAVEQMADATRTLTQRFQQRVDQQTAGLARTFAAPATLTATHAAADVEALRDHWWVQVQQERQWLDLDPSVSDAGPGRTVVGATEVVAPTAVPQALYHDVAIRVVIERWSSGRLEEATALEQRLRPLELFGQRIVLRHEAINWPSNLPVEGDEAAARLLAAFQAQQEWLPTLTIGGNRPLTQASVTASGRLNMPGAAKPAPRQSGFGGLLDAFGGGDGTPSPAEPDGHLTAEWIEYEIRSPGRAPKRLRREVFDLIGPAARTDAAAGEPRVAGQPALLRAMALAGETEILPLVADMSPEFATHVLNTTVLSQRETVREVLRAAAAGVLPTADQLTKLHAVPGELYALALARTSLSPVRHQVFLDRPNIFSFHRRIRPTDQGDVAIRRSLDIVENAVGVRPVPGTDVFQVRVSQGVTDTAAEALVLSGGCGGCRPVVNVSELWVLAPPEKTPWVALHRPDEPAWSGVLLDPDARRRVEQDLRAGYVVLISPRPVTVAGREAVGWWRVDLRSGQTIGLMESGEGQGLVEYIKTTAVFATSAAFGLGAVRGCLGDAAARASAGPGKTIACYFCGMATGFVAVVAFGIGGLGSVYASVGVGSVCSLISWQM